MASNAIGLFEAQLEDMLPQVDLLRAMYPEELVADDDSTVELLERLQHWCDNPQTARPIIPERITFTLTLPVGHAHDLTLIVEVVFHMGINIRPRQPAWLPKARMAQLEDLNSGPAQDVLSTIEVFQQNAEDQLALVSKPAATASDEEKNESLVRVWFYFPSISTRSKRDDIVNVAPHYNLTGFLLAGKPGILCLEGNPQSIDAYMKYIKTESWGDIPSQHKKVSERDRETENVERVFRGMDEITDLLEKRGERGNRGDMKALERWLVERGLGDALARVLM